MDIQSRLSIKKCRELLPNDDKFSDDQIIDQRNKLYDLARFFIEKFEQLTNFITREKTIDARARIVK